MAGILCLPPNHSCKNHSKEKLETRRAVAINCNNPPECHLHAAILPSMSAPSPNPAGALGLGDHPRPATSASNTRRNIAGPYPMATYNTTQSQDNHAPHGAHANWVGTVNHIAGGESALFQNHQLGQPQLATHQFNFSPGSYATFLQYRSRSRSCWWELCHSHSHTSENGK